LVFIIIILSKYIIKLAGFAASLSYPENLLNFLQVGKRNVNAVSGLHRGQDRQDDIKRSSVFRILKEACMKPRTCFVVWMSLSTGQSRRTKEKRSEYEKAAESVTGFWAANQCAARRGFGGGHP
jgi:hypothetical protein